MAHKIERLEKSKIFNKPHLISADNFDSVMDYINSRPDGLLSSEELAVARDIRTKQRQANITENKVGLIPISGVLTYEETMLGAICGMSSYQGILGMMRTAIAEGAEVVVLDVDSGGGEAYGTFETAKELRQLADENGIKLIAYVDGISASAAYGLTVAADEIIVNPYAEVGSIGVLTKLQNDSEKLKKEGIDRKYVYAGSNKIPFDAEGNWREGFLEDLQSKVDKLYVDFVNHVATMRGIDTEVVRNTEAKMFDQEKALELGLIDKVMERNEFANYLADLVEGKNMPISNLFNRQKEETMSNENLENETLPEAVASQEENTVAGAAELAEAIAQLETMRAEKEALEKALKTAKLEKMEERITGFSFVDDAKSLAVVLDKMNEAEASLIIDVLEKASAAVEEAVTEEMAIEGEVEVVATKSDAEIEKELTREKLKAKYAVN